MLNNSIITNLTISLTAYFQEFHFKNKMKKNYVILKK
jgi:hypothetical protein